MKKSNNCATVYGQIVSNMPFSHEIRGKKFYKAELMSVRLSGNADYIPLVIPEYAIDMAHEYQGEYVKVSGEFRSRNRHEDGKSHLQLFLFAKKIEITESMESGNEVILDGFLCKPSNYRITPTGREITDALIAVNRSHKKADYIPCIIWYKKAKTFSELPVSAHVAITGRIQSREYIKVLSENESEIRVTYEVSVKDCEVIDRGNKRSSGEGINEDAVSE